MMLFISSICTYVVGMVAGHSVHFCDNLGRIFGYSTYELVQMLFARFATGVGYLDDVLAGFPSLVLFSQDGVIAGRL